MNTKWKMAEASMAGILASPVPRPDPGSQATNHTSLDTILLPTPFFQSVSQSVQCRKQNIPRDEDIPSTPPKKNLTQYVKSNPQIYNTSNSIPIQQFLDREKITCPVICVSIHVPLAWQSLELNQSVQYHFYHPDILSHQKTVLLVANPASIYCTTFLNSYIRCY